MVEAEHRKIMQQHGMHGAQPHLLRKVWVNFTQVGMEYGKKVLGCQSDDPCECFSWIGVEKCVQYLKKDMGMDVSGVIVRSLVGGSLECGTVSNVPEDVYQACSSINREPTTLEECTRAVVAEAQKRSCRFVDNVYNDPRSAEWMFTTSLEMEHARRWFSNHKDVLRIVYYFDALVDGNAFFETLDGTVARSPLLGIPEPGAHRLLQMHCCSLLGAVHQESMPPQLSSMPLFPEPVRLPPRPLPLEEPPVAMQVDDSDAQQRRKRQRRLEEDNTDEEEELPDYAEEEEKEEDPKPEEKETHLSTSHA